MKTMGTSTPTGGIPLIEWNNTDERLELFQEGLETLCQFEDEPLCVLAVTGRHKTGKTFLSERIFMDHKPLGIVSSNVLSTIQKGTKGVRIYTSADLKVSDSGVKIILIDTEGLGATHCSAQGQSRMFAASLLISSYLIYNSFGAIDEGALEGIEFFAQLAQELKSETGYSGVFPEFHWLLRDFSLKLEEITGKKMTPEEYLESCLELSKGTSEITEKRNKTRRVLKHLFSNRDCSTMVRPTLTEFEIQRLFSLKNSELRSEFTEQARKLRLKVLKRIQPKRIAGLDCTGRVLVALLRNVVEALNSQKSINLPSLHQRALESIKIPPLKTIDTIQSEAANLLLVESLKGKIESLETEVNYWKSIRSEVEPKTTELPVLTVESWCKSIEVSRETKNSSLQMQTHQHIEIVPRSTHTVSSEHYTETMRELQQSTEVAAILSKEVANLKKQSEFSRLEYQQLKHSNDKVVELLAAAQIKLKEFDQMLSRASEEKQAITSEKEHLASQLAEERRKNAELIKSKAPVLPENRKNTDWQVLLEEKAAAFVCLDCTASIPASEFLEHNCSNKTVNRDVLVSDSPRHHLGTRNHMNFASQGTHGGQSNLNTSSCLDSSVLTIRRTPNQASRKAVGLPDGAGAILTQNYLIPATDESTTPRRLSSKQFMQAEIVEVSVKESAHNKKLYAEYRIKITKGKKIWESYKKYREFCEFASSVSSWADPEVVLSMPPSVQSIFKMDHQRSQVGTSTIADRQSLLQDLLNWVCSEVKLHEAPQLKEFLQEPEASEDDLAEQNYLAEDQESVEKLPSELEPGLPKSRDSNMNQSALLQVLSRKQKFGSIVSTQTAKSKAQCESPKNTNISTKKEQLLAGGLSLLRASASSYLSNNIGAIVNPTRTKKAVLHTQSTDRQDETNQSLSKRTTNGFKKPILFPEDSPQKVSVNVAAGRTANVSRNSSQKPKQKSSQIGAKLLSNQPKKPTTEPVSPGMAGLGDRKKSTPQIATRAGQSTLKLNEFGGQGYPNHTSSTPVFQDSSIILQASSDPRSMVNTFGDQQTHPAMKSPLSQAMQMRTQQKGTDPTSLRRVGVLKHSK